MIYIFYIFILILLKASCAGQLIPEVVNKNYKNCKLICVKQLMCSRFKDPPSLIGLSKILIGNILGTPFINKKNI